MSQLLDNIQSGVQTLSQHQRHVQNLLQSLNNDSRIVDHHPDPQSYNECWIFLQEEINDLYRAIQELQSIAGYQLEHGKTP